MHPQSLSWKAESHHLQGEQPHCGFPEANYHRHAERLARAGLRVVVIEQIETPDQLRLRNEQRKAAGKPKVMQPWIGKQAPEGTAVVDRCNTIGLVLIYISLMPVCLCAMQAAQLHVYDC